MARATEPEPEQPPEREDRALGPEAKPTGGISLDGFREVFRIPNFRRLFWGQAISALGDWVGTLAFIVAAQRLAPDRPAAVAGVLVLRLVPSFFATPIGGVLADRWNRKHIMIGSDLARLGVLLMVPLVPRIGWLLAFAFIHECFSLVFLPARDASLPNIVGKENLEAANSLVMGSSFAGIPLSGPIFALAAWAGSHYPTFLLGHNTFRARPYAFAFFFDALTFIASAEAIRRISLPAAKLSAGQAAQPFRESLGDGVRYILSRPFIRGLAYAVSLGMLGGGVLFALGIGYVRETLGGGDVEFGWLMGLFGAGMVAGFLVSQFKARGIAWLIRGSLFTMGAVLIVMSVFSWLWIGYVMALVFGTAFSVSLIVSMSATQAHTDDAHRGRVMGAVHMIVRGALSFGALASGLIAQIVPKDGIKFPLIPYRPDKNQVALVIAGVLISAGSSGVRAPDPDARA